MSSHHKAGGAICIKTHHLATPLNPEPLTICIAHAELCIKPQMLLNVLHHGSQRDLDIIRMHQLLKFFQRHRKSIRLVTQLLISLRRPFHLIGEQIPAPQSGIRSLHGKLKTGTNFFQRQFLLFFVGDVIDVAIPDH